jgi:hypothetical protein
MTATVTTGREESMNMTVADDDPSFDAFLAFLHDDNATGGKAEDVTKHTALPITIRQNKKDHPSERLPSHQHSPMKHNQYIHRISSQYPSPPHISNIDRPSIINRRQSTRSSNGEKTTIVHNNTTTTTIIDATTGTKVLQKGGGGGGGGGGGTTNKNPTIIQNGKLVVESSNSPNSTKHNNNIIVFHSNNNNNNGGGGSSPRRSSFIAPVIIELDEKWSEHHKVLRQGLHNQGRRGGNNNKTKGAKNKKGGFLSRRFDRMFHPPVASTSEILENYNINIKDEEEILSIGLSSITSNGSSKRSIHSTLLDPFFAKITPSSSSKRNTNNMEKMKHNTVHRFEEEQMTCSPAIIDSGMNALSPSSLLHQHCSNITNDEEYSLQYSSLSIEDDTSELAIGSSTNKRIIFPTTDKGATAKCNSNIRRESTTKEDDNIRDDLIELFLKGGKEKVDSQLHNSFEDTIVIRGGRGGEERTKFDEEKDRIRRKPKRSDGREHQLIFI